MRYLVGDDFTVYDLAASLKPKAYFSHGSALYLHDLWDGLSETEPSSVYLNDEQPKDNSGNGALRQTSIDQAFRRPARVSNNRALIGDYAIYLLNGMNTNRLGVINHEYDGINVSVANIERTLIDATVRPLYCGGVLNVLTAYRRARNKVSIPLLRKIYLQLRYTYPYHQAIGFYLEATDCYSKASLKALQAFPKEFDFYLANEMTEIQYCSKWRLYYPAYLRQYLPAGLLR